MSVAIIADPEDAGTKAFLADLWRCCTRYGLMIDESGYVVVMHAPDYALGGFDISDHGELLPGKRAT